MRTGVVWARLEWAAATLQIIKLLLSSFLLSFVFFSFLSSALQRLNMATLELIVVLNCRNKAWNLETERVFG
jgi:uncharacterized membrane protein